jgi:hypothetical protein
MTLETLFTLDYEPLRLDLITCSMCNGQNLYPAEKSWEDLLEKLRLYDPNLISIEEILRARDLEIMRSLGEETTICSYCEELRYRRIR